MSCTFFLTSSLRTPKFFVKEFSYFLMPCQQQKILCKWEMREVIGNICKTFPYIFIVYYFFLLPLVKS